jgi:Arc/MetJ-type ribon-helix-helix transcriptional regulator
MTTVNVRVDAETATFLERLARETGRTKSEVVRDALQALREHRARSAPLPPSQTMAHLIGSWDSGGLQLSERTGERFAEMLKEKKQTRGARRRRSAGRAARSH